MSLTTILGPFRMGDKISIEQQRAIRRSKEMEVITVFDDTAFASKLMQYISEGLDELDKEELDKNPRKREICKSCAIGEYVRFPKDLESEIFEQADEYVYENHNDLYTRLEDSTKSNRPQTELQQIYGREIRAQLAAYYHEQENMSHARSVFLESADPKLQIAQYARLLRNLKEREVLVRMQYQHSTLIAQALESLAKTEQPSRVTVQSYE